MITGSRTFASLLAIALWCACAGNDAHDPTRVQSNTPAGESSDAGDEAGTHGERDAAAGARDASADTPTSSDASVRDLPKPVRIMPLGDSLTFGTSAGGADLAGGYRIHLLELLTAEGYEIDYVGSARNGPAGFDGDHASKEGASISAIEQLWIDAEAPSNPHIILLMAGTNDALGVTANQPPEAAARALGALIERIAADQPDAQIVVSTLIPLVARGLLGFVREENASRIPVYNALVEKLTAEKRAAGAKVHLADLSAIAGEALGDGIHPSRMETYDEMAERWFPAVVRAIDGLRR